MRPIDADELIYEIVNTPLAEGFPYDKEWFDRLQSDIHKIIDMVENAPTVNEWISVKERLPNPYDGVAAIYVDDEPEYIIAVHDGKDWYSNYGKICEGEVTYWCALPEPPEVADE